MANPPGKPGFLKGITSAFDDIAREIKQDLRDMTPPAPGKPRTDHGNTVRSAAAGTAYVEIGGEDLPPPASTKTTRLANPWTQLETPGQVRIDAGFLLADIDDGVRYSATLLAEGAAPYTVSILVDDATRFAAPDNPLGKVMMNESRLFGATAYGPRSLVEDPEQLDERLTNLLNANPKLIAVGLLALDEPYAPYTLPQQVRQVEVQLEIAADFGLPAYVGHRRSLGPLAQTLLSAEALPPLIWADPLLTPEELQLVKELDMHVLVRPELTHADNAAYRDLLLKVPEEKRLLGGGSALLATATRSGHRNGPQDLPFTLKAYTQLLGREGESAQKEQLEILNRNAQRLFYKPTQPEAA